MWEKLPLNTVVYVCLAVVLLMLWIGLRYVLGYGGLGIFAYIVFLTKKLLSFFLWLRKTGRHSGVQQVVRPLRATVLTLSPVLGVVALSLHFNYLHGGTGFTSPEYDEAARIRQILAEERLLPPPEVPPAAFVDAINERPSLRTADRDWRRLDPRFVPPVLALMERMRIRGYPLVLLEGYRSPERQNVLAAQGPQVTQARGGESKHQYGLAADLAPIRDGRVVISEKDAWAMAAYVALGEEAKAAGLTWGGNWSFRDYGHVEMAGALQALKKNGT